MASNNPIKMVLDLTGMTQEKLSSSLEITRQTLNNYMADPTKIPVSVLLKLASISGYSMDKLVGGPDKIAGPEIPPFYQKRISKLNEVIKNIENIQTSINAVGSPGDKFTEYEKERISEELVNFCKIIRQSTQKPKICCFGPSDSGKSTLNNLLIGSDIFPADYSPLTSGVHVVHHISEKPSYLGPLDDTVVFGRKTADENRLERFSSLKFDITDEQSVVEHIQRTGDHESILNAFGTRKGAYYKNSEFIIDEIHIYIDNDVLNELTIHDVPGFNSGEASDDVSLTMEMAAFDIILYLSQADAFLRGEDLGALEQIIRSREDLKSVMVLATHANSVGDPASVDEKICKEGCIRLIASMSDEDCERLGVSESDYNALLSRFQGFDIYNELYMTKFNENFVRIVSELTESKISKAENMVRNASEHLFRDYSDRIESISEPIVGMDEADRERLINELLLKYDNLLEVTNKSIRAFDEQTCMDYESFCKTFLNKDELIRALERKGIKNNKEGRELFANYVNNTLNSKLTSILEKASTKFASELDENLKNYGEIDPKIQFDSSISMREFNIKRAFISGMTGVATYGALATWAAITAAGSNLGAYILTAKVVAFLSSIGISLGGTAAVAAAVSAVGGPVTIGITLSLIAVITAFGIISGTWKSRYVNKLLETYQKKGYVILVTKEIHKYWADTETAFCSCAKALRDESINFVKKEYDRSNLEAEEQANINVTLKLMYRMVQKLFSELCK